MCVCVPFIYTKYIGINKISCPLCSFCRGQRRAHPKGFYTSYPRRSPAACCPNYSQSLHVQPWQVLGNCNDHRGEHTSLFTHPPPLFPYIPFPTNFLAFCCCFRCFSFIYIKVISRLYTLQRQRKVTVVVVVVVL